MSSIAEKIYETVKNLPEQQAAEILSLAEALKAKQEAEQHKAALLECFSQFHIDMSGFKFDREDANARR
jgi:hypothetical protein